MNPCALPATQPVPRKGAHVVKHMCGDCGGGFALQGGKEEGLEQGRWDGNSTERLRSQHALHSVGEGCLALQAGFGQIAEQ